MIIVDFSYIDKKIIMRIYSESTLEFDITKNASFWLAYANYLNENLGLPHYDVKLEDKGADYFQYKNGYFLMELKEANGTITDLNLSENKSMWKACADFLDSKLKI